MLRAKTSDEVPEEDPPCRPRAEDNGPCPARARKHRQLSREGGTGQPRRLACRTLVRTRPCAARRGERRRCQSAAEIRSVFERHAVPFPELRRCPGIESSDRRIYQRLTL